MYYRIKTYIIVLAMAIAVALPANAKIKISGKVTDETNNPIEFATVRIQGTALGTATNDKGEYELSVADTDTLMVIFSCIGYEEVKRRYIKPTGNLTINAKLYEKQNVLGDLQVTEIRRQTSQMQTIDASTSRITPDASGGSIESVLTTMAGVSSKNEMSSQYMVRGGSYDENSVYINGIEIYRPQLISNGQQEGLSIINPDLVGSVKFSTGGFAAEYGDKMSSVLDIAYREPEAFEASAALSLQGGSLSVGQSSKKFSQLHGFRFKRNSGLLGSLESKGEYDPKYFDYQTFINFAPSKKWKISFLGNIAINNYRFTPESRETSFGTSSDAKSFKVYFDGFEKDRFETFFGALSLGFNPNENHSFSLLASGYQTNELVSYDIHGEYWLDQAGGTDGSGATVGGELGVGKYHEHERNRLKASVLSLSLKGGSRIAGNSIAYGVGMHRESIFENSRQWEWRDSAGYSLPHLPNEVNVIFNQSSKHDFGSTRIGAFLQDTYKINSAAGFISINGGVRLSYWDFNKELLVSPRASVGFVPAGNERFSMRLATGLYYQAPFYKEYRYATTDAEGNSIIALNSDIKSQRSFQVIAGGDYTFRAINRPFKFTAEIYYKNLSNLIPYEVENLKVVYSGINASKGYVAGLDMKFFGQFVEGSDSWISFSLMKTQEDIDGVKVPRPTDQRYSIGLFFTDYFPKIPRLKFSLKGILSDGLPTTAPHSTRNQGYFRMPAYKRVDIGMSYQLVSPAEREKSPFLRHFKEAWIGIDVFNLLDISNVSSYYWVTDVNNIQYAVPNYLTRRQINVRLSARF